MNATYISIKQALKNELPGIKSHKKMMPPNRELQPPSNSSKTKNSSVLLLLFEENQELYTCLIKRPGHMKNHAGQIALPGGRIEKNETDIETALRETHEEIGILKNEIEIIGRLSELYVSVSSFIIQPFVGWLKQKPVFKINPNEVEKTVLFPLMKYKSCIEFTKLNTLTGTLNVPCIKYNNEIIWGATLMILSEFYDVLKKD